MDPEGPEEIFTTFSATECSLLQPCCIRTPMRSSHPLPKSHKGGLPLAFLSPSIIPPADRANTEHTVLSAFKLLSKQRHFLYRGKISILQTLLSLFEMYTGLERSDKIGNSCKEENIHLAWRYEYVYDHTWRQSCKQFEANTLILPQLVKSLFMLSMKSKRIPKAMARGQGWGLQCSGLV